MLKKFFAKFKKKKVEPMEEEIEYDEWDKEREKNWELLKEKLSLDDPIDYHPKHYKR